MPSRRARAAAAIPMALALLTGCATTSPATRDSSVPIVESSAPASPTPSPTPSTSAASGSTASSDHSFAVVLPQDWKSTKAGPAGTVLAVKAGSATHQVYSNIIVAAAHPRTVPTLQDLAQQGELDMRQEGADITPLADRTIGGEPAKGYALVRAKDGTQVAQVQYFVLHGETTYVVTASSAVPDRDRLGGLLDAFLATWAWTD